MTSLEIFTVEPLDELQYLGAMDVQQSPWRSEYCAKILDCLDTTTVGCDGAEIDIRENVAGLERCVLIL